VSDIEQACEFYSTVLGCKIICFISSDGVQRHALQIGESSQKINLHPAGHPFQPAAKTPQPGSADLCLITSTPLESVIEHFHSLAVPIIEGPVLRTGTLGSILSVYIRDLDGNLIEVANSMDIDI